MHGKLQITLKHKRLNTSSLKLWGPILFFKTSLVYLVELGKAEISGATKLFDGLKGVKRWSKMA